MMMHQRKLKLIKKTTIESLNAMIRSRKSARATRIVIIAIKRRKPINLEADALDHEVSNDQSHEAADAPDLVAAEDQSLALFRGLDHGIEIDEVLANDHVARTIEKNVKKFNVTMYEL